MNKLKPSFPLALFFVLLLALSCEQMPQQLNQPIILPYEKYSVEGDSVQTELDEIYSLLAYSLVYKDWQPESVPRNERRGYNIGTILVNENNEVVHWGLNCINSTDNATQHGEVRAITSYLDSLRSFNLKGFTLYTTLEPCAMCSGMATMTNIARVVYGQKDVDFSGALDRLALNSESCGGFKPYPRVVISDPSPSNYRIQLDSAFQYFLETEDEKYLAKFLSSEKARQFYENAYQNFLSYKVNFPKNNSHYAKARQFFDRINIYLK